MPRRRPATRRTTAQRPAARTPTTRRTTAQPSAARPPTRDYHPATRQRTSRAPAGPPPRVEIPRDVEDTVLSIGSRDVKLTNLGKVFWRDLGLTKRDLLQYYADVAPVLLPHVRDRAMVMKRYPNGADGEFFFMKRAPTPRPDWIETCAIEHSSGNVIHFPMVQDLATLLWVVNLGCIDLNQWYARCDDVDRPDYLHVDLDPGEGVDFPMIRDASFVVRDALEALGMPTLVKTTGSRGIHVYVPIVRGPTQKEVWSVSKAIAVDLARRHPRLLTAEYRRAQRPHGRVLVDYNQNAWGRTLASIYSVRPRPRATVSTPVTWTELERGVEMEDFRIDNVPARIARVGDLWAPLLARTGRVDLARVA